jgi:hypothetical protein
LTDAHHRVRRPALDLFVDANSPHPAEKFGCTICHSGQGSATDFKQATHTPNDPEQKRVDHEVRLVRQSLLGFSDASKQLSESGCLQCHHQVTDTIRYGNKEEARSCSRATTWCEYGCFGCHEISGVKGGRWVGPDMRLEDGIPLEEKPAFDRARRRPIRRARRARCQGRPEPVSPRREDQRPLAGQVDQSPRGFRPDTHAALLRSEYEQRALPRG